jgi:hypothetical protein
MPSKLVNLGNHNEPSLNPCNDKGFPAPIADEPAPPYCNTEPPYSHAGWLENASNKKTGLGREQLCDPMQTGQIVNDVDRPNRNVLYRYSKGIRACDEAVQDLFRNMVVIDEDGKAHPVPITWASQEKAVAAILQDNVRKDNSLVVDRIRLPMMAIYSNSFQYNQQRYIYHKAVDYMRYLRPDGKPGFTTDEKRDRDTVFGMARGIPVDIGYTLYAWTLYVEDMNQLLEQLFLKFSPIAYIRVRGVPWETAVKLDSVASNLDVEPGDQNVRVVKFEFNLTAETYIPQPLVRHKAVLKTRTSVSDNLNTEQITGVIERLEQAVEELK